MLFRKRTFLLMALSIGLLLVAKPNQTLFWIGLPLVLIGEAIRVWSAGYLTKLSGLVTAGPFAMCRNPLYIGSFLISLGYFIMCNNVIVLAVGVALFWMLHGAAVAYEEGLLRDKFGEDFIVYCKRVPRFFPRLRMIEGQGSFSLRQVMANDEYRSAIGAVVFLTVFGLMAFDFFSIAGWLGGLAD